STEEGGGNGGPRLGLSVTPLTPEIAGQLGLGRNVTGVVVAQVDPNGPAAEAGVQEGDVIQQVNREPVRRPEDVRALAQKSGDRPALLLINRKGQTIFVAVPLR